MMMTPAGTIAPARVFVIGAGVAGLQAIATAKRLGAKVFGYDIREPTREEVESLGASFVELEVDIESDQDESGYAEELEKEKQERQPELLKPHIAEADVVISTALIPGRPAPLLINENAVEAMDPGSVIVDLAAPNGGNCAYTETGEEIVEHNVQILGPTNLPAEMPVHASELYAKTVVAMIEEGLDDGRVRRFLRHVRSRERPSGAEVATLMAVCMAATYDPDPEAPNGFRLPFHLETGELLPARWRRW